MDEHQAQYQCPCGCGFPEELGKYGCPNCEGDEGPAELEGAE